MRNTLRSQVTFQVDTKTWKKSICVLHLCFFNKNVSNQFNYPLYFIKVCTSRCVALSFFKFSVFLISFFFFLFNCSIHILWLSPRQIDFQILFRRIIQKDVVLIFISKKATTPKTSFSIWLKILGVTMGALNKFYQTSDFFFGNWMSNLYLFWQISICQQNQ